MEHVQEKCSVNMWRAKNSPDVVEMSGLIQPQSADQEILLGQKGFVIDL